MDNHTLSFVASMTVCPSDIRKIRQHVTLAEPSVDPLQNILVTPLFVNDDALAMAQRSEEHTSELQSRENLVCRLRLHSFPTRRSSDLCSILSKPLCVYG